MKFKKQLKKNKYLGIDFINRKNNGYENEYFNEYKKEDYDDNYILNSTIKNNMNNTTIINNLDLPSESQIFEGKEKDNEYDQILEVFDFINNVNSKNAKEDNKNKIKILGGINNQKSTGIKKINLKKNSVNYDRQQNLKHSYYMEDNFSQFSEIHRNKTQTFNKFIVNKNMELTRSINFDDLIL